MAADKEHSVTPLNHIPLNHMNKDTWCISDISVQSLDKIVLSGCKQKSKKTFINVFSVEHSDPSSKPKSLYSREFNKKHTSELWRLVSFLDDSHIITCFDDWAEKISIKKDKAVQSRKLPRGRSSCISVKERDVFIGFSESCDVIVLNSNLHQTRTVTLDALRGGWPVDLVVVPDTLLICSVGSTPRRALAVREEDGQLLREYTNPRSDDSVPLSLTVSAETDLVGVLWNSPPQLTIHSFSHGHCLVVADVEPAERIRGIGQDKLVMVDEKGEMKVFLLKQIFTFYNLKAILTLLLSESDCRDIADFFGLPCDLRSNKECSDSDKQGDDQDSQNQKFLSSLESSGKVSSGNVKNLLEALKELDKSDSLISAVDAYEKYSGSQKGRKRTRKKSPRGRKDDSHKRKKVSEDSYLKEDKTDACTSGEEPDSSDAKQDTTADEAEGKVTPSTEQTTPISPSTGLKECENTQQLSEVDVSSEKHIQEMGSTVDEDSEEIVMETEHENENATEEEEEENSMKEEEEENGGVERGESNKRSNDGPTLKERMITMLGEIQALKQQNELILSILRTQPAPHLYPQPYPYTQQYSQHPSVLQSMQTGCHVPPHQLSNANTPIQPQSQPIQQAQVPNHSLPQQQIGYTQTGQTSHLPQAQPPSCTQSQQPPPSLAPPSLQLVNPLQPTQPVTLQPQVQFTPQPGTQIPPCTCKVPPPSATSMVAQSLPVTVPSATTVVSSHQLPSTPLPPTTPNKSTSQASVSATPTQAHGPPPIQQTFNPPPPSYSATTVTGQPNPHVTFQPPVPVYAYHHPFAPPYIPGPMPPGSPIQMAPYPAPQLSSYPQGHAQAATNPPSQVPSQTVSLPTVPQQIPSVPSTPILSAPVGQSTDVPSQHGATATLPTATPSTNVVIAPIKHPSIDESSLLALWQTLPLTVQVEITPYKGSDNPKARDRVARRLIRHYFPSDVRIKSNCAGAFGYAPLDPEKLYHTRCLTFYLCPMSSGGAEAEAIEWKRLIKIIDAFNRSHRKYTNSKMSLMNGGSNQAFMKSKRGGSS